ncbi:MAG TPA: glycoside hydrolase family 16 protein [Candidatus Sulfotelmatobacter sp.]|nr:glycoside hydrolase family 16 protein [Candidatus Sulfotelmatobacter sp.]
MPGRSTRFLEILLLIGLLPACQQLSLHPPSTGGAPSAPTSAEWVLVWHDEFDGTTLDPDSWNVESGTTWSYGSELQYWSPKNVIVGNGMLRLISRRESVGGRSYSSGAVTTKGKRTFVAGWLEVRARLPKGQGVWPAIWTREGEMPDPDNGAEIDLVEMLGREPTRIYMSNHSWGTRADDGRHTLHVQCHYSGPDFSKDFHVYAIEIDSGSIRWFIDGVQRCGPATAGLPTLPNYLLLNTSIGGAWGGDPDSTTVFPQSFDIDYVRVYEKRPAAASDTRLHGSRLP